MKLQFGDFIKIIWLHIFFEVDWYISIYVCRITWLEAFDWVKYGKQISYNGSKEEKHNLDFKVTLNCGRKWVTIIHHYFDIKTIFFTYFFSNKIMRKLISVENCFGDFLDHQFSNFQLKLMLGIDMLAWISSLRRYDELQSVGFEKAKHK